MQEINVIRKENCSACGIRKSLDKIVHSPLFLSFSINFCFFLVSIICFHPVYEVSDDYMIDAVLSGAFGDGYNPYLLWGNPILGFFLVVLYKLIPGISFYFVLLVTLSFISSTAVIYLLFSKKINVFTICLSLIYLCMFSDDLYVLVQFSKVSAAAGIAGGLLILYGLWEEQKHKVRYVVAGTVLALIGSMVRFTIIYLYGAFLLITFLFYAVSFIRKNGKIKKAVLKLIGFRLLICLFLVGILFGVNNVGYLIRNNDSKYGYFNSFDVIRYSITDTMKPDYDVVQEEFENLGLDTIDYCMLASWQFVDNDVYSDELLTEVAEIFKGHVAEETHSVSYIFNVLIGRNILIYPAAYVLYLFVVIALLLSKRKLFPVVLLLTSLCFFCFFIFNGRTMYRVEWSVYFCAVACFFAVFSYDENSSFATSTIKLLGKKISFAAIGAAVILLYIIFVRVLRVVPDSSFRNMDDTEYRIALDDAMSYSGEYVPDKVKLLMVYRRPHPELISLLENDAEHYYYVDFPTAIQQLYYDYDPWIRPEEGLFHDHYAYFGSVVMHHPGECETLADNGADPYSPYKSLINKNILMVDTWWPELKLDYVRKYYYPDAQIELANEADGYQIWNIYLPLDS